MAGSKLMTLLVHLAVLAMAAVGATELDAQEAPEVPREVRLDIDRDGKLDLAVIVEPPGDGSGDLLVYLGLGNGKLDPGRKPDFVKKDLLTGTIRAFKSQGNNALTLTTCLGCTSMVWIEEKLTIVFRDQTLVVGGFDQGWEVSRRLADGNVDVSQGSCSINFLTGQARVAHELGPDSPVKQRFERIGLADWSEERIPAICLGR